MGTNGHDAKDEVLARATQVADRRGVTGALPAADVERLLRFYFRNVPADDLDGADPVDVYGTAMSHFRLATMRAPGTAAVRVYTPTVEEHGWASTHTVVEIVTDDMPFLVDSVTMALSRRDHGIYLVVHPQLIVRRDGIGQLEEFDEGVAHPDELDDGTIRESWIHVEIDRQTEPRAIKEIESALQRVLGDVRNSVEDWPRMQAKADAIIEGLASSPPDLSAREVDEARELLAWLCDSHFTFLGYREYVLDREDGEDVLRAVPDSGLGILRTTEQVSRSFSHLPPRSRAKARERTLLVLSKANSRATVHRPSYLDYIGIKTFDENGAVTGERRFLGLLTSVAYTESVQRIPVLRGKVDAVLDRSGFARDSHSGKALLDILETFPRDELFQIPDDELLTTVMSILHLQERRQLRVFARKDDYDRYVSCLVYIPRDRFATHVRLKIQELLLETFAGEQIDFALRFSESVLARLHFVVRMPSGRAVPEFDVAELEQRLANTIRTWDDEFADALVDQVGEARAADLQRRCGDAFPEAYKEDFTARTGAADLCRLVALVPEGDLALSLYEPIAGGVNERRFKIYRTGAAVSLSQVLPLLSAMGVEVTDQRPYSITAKDGVSGWIYDFGLAWDERLGGVPEDARTLFQEAFAAVWAGAAESDGFNALVLRGGLAWRQIMVLRAYAKYLRQCGSTFSQAYIEDALAANVEVAGLLVELFETRFDPSAPVGVESRRRRVDDIVERIEKALDAVASLDQDRIIRSLLTLISTTLRTNYFQTDADGNAKTYLAIKFDPRANHDLPEPRPAYEIWVYSPRVEGVHLRFGPVARGGLRWSDRREDFRTEVLGLVKAQMVKNTVITPVGAKGGFYAKRLPNPNEDRDAWLREGMACYRTFISGLLDITDNLVEDVTVPPAGVVRHDGDDAYLVVAADKGTATFSDLANEVAAEYGFWLGDAFASGGSVGYDHKAMGITARGAWESVRRHFRELGRDCQTEPFSCVGIGDMSGDVFGNGLLCSEQTRLVAAFDHRHIFLDPDPDPAASYAERRRLFDLPRSSWDDYDRGLLSAGGAVVPRSAKSVRVTPQVKAALGIEGKVEAMTPYELIRAILKAPVDLLWNGGIGTYVKASTETHARVGDKANDALRVDGGELRCKCVGEGGNLGFTQLGRIEYATAGGLINTDFIDNSAGVDTSDHEVNIKILLDQTVRAGDLTRKQRNELLSQMTDEVADLVLDNTYQQNVSLSQAVELGPRLLHVHASWIRRLEKAEQLHRELEFLPSDKQLRDRRAQGSGLTAPELAVLLSYTKLVLSDELLESELPDDPYLHKELVGYFPGPMRERFRDRMDAHPLRREIITTLVVNRLVNTGGITFYHRLSQETGATLEELARAHVVARAIFDVDSLWAAIEELDHKIDAGIQTRMRLEGRTIAERAARWLVQNRRSPIDIAATIEHFRDGLTTLMTALPDVLCGRDLTLFEDRRDRLVASGVAPELATKVAVLSPAYGGLGMVETIKHTDADLLEVARVHFTLGERLDLGQLLERILTLPREDRWQTTARAALRDDLHTVHAALTANVLAVTPDDADPDARVAAWEERDAVVVARALGTLDELVADEKADLARLSVGLRVVRTLLPTAG